MQMNDKGGAKLSHISLEASYNLYNIQCIYVCMYVCMYVWYVCMYVYMVCMYVCMYVCI